MRSFIPRLIAFCISVLLAVLPLLDNFTTEALIMTVVLLGLLALSVFAGSDKNLVRAAPSILLSWFFFGFIGPDPQQFVFALRQTFNALDQAGSSLTIFIVAVLIAQIFLRGSDNIVLILVRYILMGGLLITLSDTVVQSPVIVQLMILNLIVHLLYELITLQDKDRKGRSISCLLTGLGIVISGAMGGVGYISQLLTLSVPSLLLILAMVLLGALTILEEKAVDSSIPDSFSGAGSVLLYWSVVALVMVAWPATANINFLVLCPILLFFAYASFTDSWNRMPGRFVTPVMHHMIWSIAALVILVISKAYNNGNVLLPCFVALAVIAALICWHSTKESENEKRVMIGFLGVVSVLLLCFAESIDFSNIPGIIAMVLTVCGLSVFWNLLCGKIAKLDDNASSVDKTEFSIVRTVHVYVPLVIAAVGAIKILLF